MAYIKNRKHPIARSNPVAQTLATAKAATVLTGLALTLPLHAQTGTPGAAPTLPQVNVRGEASSDYKADSAGSPKFTQPLVDTTQSISVIKEQIMREQGATTLTEALRNVPGVSTFFVGENGNSNTGDAVYMRGFDSSSSIFVDGVRDLGSISRDVFNTEQIDVIKGPSGSDFGRSAPTGSINMVTKQPRLDDSFDASLGLGSGSYKRSTVDWNKKLEGFDGAAFRLNAMVQDAGVPGRDHVKNDRWGIAPSLALGLGTDNRAFIDLLHVKQKNTPDGGVFTLGLPGYTSPDPARPYLGTAPAVNSKNYYGTASDRDDVTADMATLRLEHDFSADTTVRNTTRWGRSKQDYLLTAPFASSAFFIAPAGSDPSTWRIRRLLNTKDVRNEILTNQTNFTTRLETAGLRHDLSTGVELTREKQTNWLFATLNAPEANVYNPDSSVTIAPYDRSGAYNEGQTTTYAIYAFDTLHLNSQWQLNAGLRYEHYRTEYDSFPATGATTAPTFLKKSDNLLNYKVGVLYKPLPNGSVYVNYALSQQPPGGNNFQLAAAGSGTSANRTDFNPQKAKSTELGTKWELMDKKLLLSAALFRTEIENEVVNDTANGGGISQDGKKRVQGLELGAVGQITPAWSVSAGFTVQNAKVEKGASLAADGGSELTYTPKTAATLWSTYQLPYNLTLGGGARYSGGLKRGTDGAIGTPSYTESYWVFDAMAGYKVSKNVNLQFNVYNLFDKDYVAAINKSGYRYLPGVERSYRLVANVSF